MSFFKNILKGIPAITSIVNSQNKKFQGTASYWEERYSAGGDSGAGSYNQLAEFKAEVLNSFVKENNIETIIEFGCGDGNQLSLINYPTYVGLDISKTAISICINKFGSEPSKSFFVYDSSAFCDNLNIFKADLTLSLDVLYHIIEDELFDKYMHHLFNASKRFVIIYSNNYDDRSALHVRERNFTKHIETCHKNWKLKDIIKNKYPYDHKNPDQTSSADFYIYQKVN